MNYQKTNLLNEIKKQIERFDAKASILTAISGILLGMSFGWIPIFKKIEILSMKITMYFLFIFVFLYVLFLFLAIFIFIWSILPRSKPKKIKEIKTNNFSLYYKDLQKMEINNIEEILKNEESDLLEQIKINSIIASKKHKNLIWGILFLLLSIFSIIIFILFYMFV